ncbi:MAG: gliding motility-associated C-terminal domain-containing protein [Bacteroidetes bacterium]|nr:gliding motility-associated C-terminal domain-containing protein [Bacteroidota bacterium]
MKTSRLILSWLFTVIAVYSAYAQEAGNCADGKDNDNDGFIDCFDSDCAADTVCAGFYLNNNVVCQAKPTGFPAFTMKLAWQSDNQTTNHLNRTSVGDLDYDGYPEVVVTEIIGKNIFILDGRTGATKKSLNVSYNLDREVVIGNIDKSSCAWIFTSGDKYIYAYDCNLNFKWKSSKLSADPWMFGLADFDNDGKIEIFSRNEIIDAHTGVRMVKNSDAGNMVGGPVAVDITGDSKLELIAGCRIYSVVDLKRSSLPTQDQGSLTLSNSVPNFYRRQSQSSTSVADYNLDGYLDVIASGSNNSQDSNTTLFFWDVQNNVVKTYIDIIPGDFYVAGCTNATVTAPYANGWQNGTGRLNIADIDGDGKLNATYVSGKYLYALDENWNLKWRVVVNEETSGYTGCTVYDFNGDGAAEVVYRDEQYIYIINGNDGSVNTQQQCIARTQVEYPVVADVNGDGATELCVTCGYDDALSWSNFCDLSYSQNSCVRVFQSASTPWVPSRKLWNQHAYFNVNVNNDLTIPQYMQKSWLVWSTNVCTTGANRPLNAFLNQTPARDSQGCPTYASPNLINVASLLKVEPPTCPDTDFKVTIGVQNIGDATIQGNVPVTFYKGDPTKTGATKLNTVNIPVNLIRNQTQTFPSLTVTGDGSIFTLYISLNDAGTSVPTPIKLPNTPFVECDYDNVIKADVIPKPVQVVATKIADNIKCVGASVPDNGAASAYVDMGGTQNTADYNFYWFNGPVTGSPVYTGASYSGLAAGTYSVYALHKTANCSSDTATVTIIRKDKAPMIATIVQDAPNTSCSIPNGKMHAVVNGGDPIINYTFDWFQGNDIFTSPEIGVGDTATNLLGGQIYTVLVTDNSSGCQSVASQAVPDNTVRPVVTAIPTDAICAPANSGSASASVAGVTTGFTFKWYNGSVTKPSPDFTGANYAAIPAGSYTVTATDNSKGCVSNPSTVTVGLPPPFTATASQLTQQTSCNPATPNGSATANVGGTTAGYNFNWFTGQSTAPGNAIPSAVNVAAGDYTVIATNTTTGCTDTTFTTVTQNLVYPAVSLVAAPNTVCDPTLTSPAAQFNGSITATITNQGGNPLSDYTFTYGDPGAQTPGGGQQGSPTANVWSQLNGGATAYTVQVTQVSTGCASAPGNIVVTNTQAIPVITKNQLPSTNCAPTAGNGSALVTDVDGAGIGAPYQFKWYDGSTVTPGSEKSFTATYANVQGGSGMNYTVQVTNQSNGCQNTATVLVGDSKVLPTLSLVSAPNTVCDPTLTSPAAQFNGSITATITNQGGNPLSDYTFTYGDPGAQTPGGGQQGSPTANAWSQLNGGATAYTVQVTQVSTGCASTPSNIKVTNTQAIPVITKSQLPSTNCAPTAGNGSALVTDVDGAGVGTPYQFKWYDGSTVTPGSEKSFAATYANVQGGAGKNYTVQVTNQSNGCQNTATVLVGDSKVLPLISLVKADNTVCDPTLTNPSVQFSGSITTTITNIGLNPLSDYTFSYTGGGAQTPGGGSKGSPTANVWSQLNGGASNYKVQVTQVSTGCKSSTKNIKITNTQTIPVITASQLASTNCAPTAGNGSAMVTDVDGAGVGTPYQFKWYDGAAVVVGSEKALTATYANVQGGVGKNYTVQVTNQSNGCRNTATVLVGDNSALPVITLSETDNTSCLVGKNGTASLATLNDANNGGAVVSPFTGYTFNWNTGGTTSTISSLDSGSYTLTVKNSTLGCVSAPVSIKVKNNLFTPPITINITPQTSCTTPNGILSATIDETSIGGGAAVTAGYTFAWENNNNPFVSPGTSFGGNTPQVTGLTGNKNYSVTVVKTSSGCTNSKSAFVNNTVVVPVATLTPTDQVKCSPPDGQVVANVAQVPTQTYTYYWMLEQPNTVTTDTATVIGTVKGSPASPNRKFTGATGSSTDTDPNLHYGDYTLVVVDNFTHCISQPVTATVQDKTESTITINDFIKASLCKNSDGTIKISAVRNDATPTNFTFDIYKGSPTNTTTPINFYTNPPTFSAAKNPGGVGKPPFLGLATPPSPATQGLLSASPYTIIATDDFGCKNYVTHTVPFVDAQTAKLDSLGSTLCSVASGNGSISNIIVTPPATSVATQADYAIYIYEQADSATTVQGPIKQAAPASFTNLAPGIYTVEVDAPGFDGGCPIYHVVEIKALSLPPVISLNSSIIANNACVAASYNGQIDIKADKDPDDQNPNAITYDISKNGSFQVNVAAGSDKLFSNLAPGDYTFGVKDPATGCASSRIYHIDDQPAIAQLTSADVTITDAQYCTAALERSAKVVVNSIKLQSGATENIPDYQFDWFSNATLTTNLFSAVGDGASPVGGDEFINKIPLPSSGTVAAGTVKPGSYWVVLTKQTDTSGKGGVGCVSSPFKVNIVNKAVIPVVTMTPSPNTACDAFYEGKITINSSDSGGPGAGQTYSYTWDGTNPTAIGNTVANDGNPLTNLGDGDVTSANLRDGTYKISVVNNATGCAVRAQTNVLQSATPVVVTNSSHTDQLLCTADGSITVGTNDIVVNGTPDTNHNNFTFDWYAGSTSSPKILTGIAQDVLNIGNYASIGAGDYYLVVTRKSGTPVGSGCSAAPLKVTINNKSVNPDVTMTPSPNTACDTNYEGKITVNASDSGGPGVGKTYTYAWNAGNPMVIAGGVFNGSGNLFTNLKDGGASSPYTPYILLVTNNTTGCKDTAQAVVLQSATPVVVANASPMDQFLCTADGSIVVGANDILVNGTADPAHANFTFDWYKGSISSPVVLSGFGADALNIGTYPTISAGDYYLTVTRKSGTPVGSGCQSAPFKVTINNKSVNPDVTMSPLPNTACDTNYEGKITVNASDSGGPGAAPGHTYTYAWNAGNPTTIASGSAYTGSADMFTNLKDGGASSPYIPYILTVTNNTTGCSTTTQTVVLPSATPILTVNATVVDQAICNPDGKITVGSVLVDGAADPDHTHFTFNWYLNDPLSAPIVSGNAADVLSTLNYATIGKGTYYVTATRSSSLPPGSGCTSPPLRADIKDVHVNPTIAASTINPDINCAGGSGVGKITINEASPLNFTYLWFTGDNISGTPVAGSGTNGEVAQNLQEGDYTVQVRDNASNCVSVQSYTVANNPSIVTIDPTGFTTAAVLNCDITTGAVLSNGSATITTITENSASQPLGNYVFTWTDSTNAVLQNGASPALTGLAPGNYFVHAVSTVSNCMTDFGFNVEDKTVGTTTVTLVDFKQPERCVNPATGYLTVQGGGTGASYSYEWYAGDVRPTPSGATLATSATLSNIAIAAGQVFTVKVINGTNNCWALDAYTVPLITNPIVLTASGNPLTYCSSNNGEAFATTVNDNKFDYNYFWGIGTTVNPATPDFTGNDIVNLPAGNYTAIAVDKLDPGCISPMDTATIADKRSYPTVTTQVVKGLTICDPARPDGDVSANVAGDVVHYFFDWYVGASATGTSFFRGAEVGGLTNTTYTVLATETTTGCTGTASVTVPLDTVAVPTPTVVVVSNVTSCIEDNGSLSVSVNGVTKDYIFDWRNGDLAPPPIDFTGEIYDSLKVGDYTVIATSRATGCVSKPATKPIIVEQIYPAISFLIQNATCNDSNGFITILVNNKLPIDTIMWYNAATNQEVNSGPNLQNAMAGDYIVKVTTTLGCEKDFPVKLPADINVFNGISRRPDAMNDFFLIECIENFDRNHVEIFNRAGTKVYEADGYNNASIRFVGESNRGISLMGTNLPSGTYFYVISKGDGTRRVVGYLELVD